MGRTTHTYVTLLVSEAAYDEIARKLRAAGYNHVFMDDGAIDMYGIAISATHESDDEELDDD